MLWALWGVGGGYLGLVAALYLLQRRLTYYPDPTPLDPDDYDLPGLGPLESVTADGLELRHLFRPPAEPTAPVIVHFHGNAGHAGGRVERLAWLEGMGLGLLFAEYRGFGGNPGRPSERGLFADAASVVARLAELGIAADRLVLYGESLGSGVAVATAAACAAAGRPVRGLILEAPFTSVAETAQHHYWYTPAKWLVRERYDSAGRITGVGAPLLVLHGTADRTVPYKLGHRLFEAAVAPKRMLTVPRAGHTDLHEFPQVREAVRLFLADCAAAVRR